MDKKCKITSLVLFKSESCVMESDHYVRSFLFLPVLGGHSGCGLSTKEGWGAEI